MQPKWLISHLIFFLVHVKPSSAEEPGYPQMSPLAQGHLHRVVLEGQPDRVLGGDSWTGEHSVCSERQVKGGQASCSPLLVSRVARMR